MPNALLLFLHIVILIVPERQFLRRVDTVYNALDRGINIKKRCYDDSCPGPDTPDAERTAPEVLDGVSSSGRLAATSSFPYCTSHPPVNESPSLNVETAVSKAAPARIPIAQSSHPITGKV